MLHQSDNLIEPLSDNISGFPTDEDKNLADYNKASQDLFRSSKIDKMLDTDGWKLLEDFLNSAIETHTGQLVYELDPGKIVRLQALVQALKFLPRVVQQLKLDGEQAKQVLNSFVEQTPFMG